jgi:uncharacterized protein YndB with AHSA1/START domain
VDRAVINSVVEIQRPPVDVFDYVSDHTREPEWNPKMRFVRKLTGGPIGNGTRYEMEFIPGRPMVVSCVQFHRPNCWEVAGDTLGMHVSMGGQITATAAGSQLVFRTEFRARGPMALALPLLRHRMAPELQRDVEAIKAILESPPAVAVGLGHEEELGISEMHATAGASAHREVVPI